MRLALRNSRAPAAVRSETAAGTRILYLQLLRAIAICLVVFNHSGTAGYMLFLVTENPVTYPFYLFLSIICKIAVPLFFLVSGSLLITKEESVGRVYSRRVLRLAVALLVFSLIQYLYTLHRTGEPFDAGYFFKALYSSNELRATYNFLYHYLAVLVMLPLLRRMARAMTNREYLYLAALQIVWVGMIPIVCYLGGWPAVHLELPLVAQNIFYFVMGHFLGNRLPETWYRRTNVYWAIGAALVAILVTGLMTWLKGSRSATPLSEASAQTFFSGLIAIPTFAVFYLVRYWCGAKTFRPSVSKAIVWFGGLAFGIYLIEHIARKELDFIFTGLRPYVLTLPAALIWLAAVIVVCGAVIAVLKLIPGVRRIL